jgi:hypothetical protein
VAYRYRLLTVTRAAQLGLTMLAVNVALVRFGPYEPSLVGIEGQQLKNMAPPSLLLAGHAIMMCAFAIAAAPAIGRWARRPRVWWLTVIGNSGAMTLYLWHIPALLGVHLAFDLMGLPRYPGQPHFLALSIVQLVTMGVVVAALFVALRPLENNPLPYWDGGTVGDPGVCSAAVGALLCVAGAATVASVGWGLKDLGLYFVASMVAALVAARAVATNAMPGGEISTGRHSRSTAVCGPNGLNTLSIEGRSIERTACQERPAVTDRSSTSIATENVAPPTM